jgi:catechol 2,3-dioxygenase-like lactoylglutathione lyase family enzyme
MYTHVMLGANDLERAKKFYDASLGALGVPPGAADGNRVFYITPTGMFVLTTPLNGEPATAANGGTIGFAADSPAQADAWYAAGLAAGGVVCDGVDGPGVREGGLGKLYLAYLRDPDGNKLCVLHKM